SAPASSIVLWSPSSSFCRSCLVCWPLPGDAPDFRDGWQTSHFSSSTGGRNGFSWPHHASSGCPVLGGTAAPASRTSREAYEAANASKTGMTRVAVESLCPMGEKHNAVQASVATGTTAERPEPGGRGVHATARELLTFRLLPKRMPFEHGVLEHEGAGRLVLPPVGRNDAPTFSEE